VDKNESPGNIRTLQRAIDILNCFVEEKSELTLTELANQTTLAKSTTTRLLATLEMNHFVEKDPETAKYRLGRQLYFLGFSASRSIELKSIAEPTMKCLRDLTKETVNLYILDGKQRVCIQQYESEQSVKHMIRIGQRLPLTVGAGGKALLAYQSKEFIDEVTAIQPQNVNLENELQYIVEKKYTVSIDERETGTSAAASPVFNMKGEVVAALSVSGPSGRFQPQYGSELETIVVDAAIAISRNLGYLSDVQAVEK
jgi:DNA-binding IclR family transcriptional regulator